MYSRTQKGAMGEALAVAWFYSHGFSVFKNFDGRGPVDLIVMRDDVIIPVDVKYIGYEEGNKSLSHEQKRQGVYMLRITLEDTILFTPSREQVDMAYADDLYFKEKAREDLSCLRS